MTKLLTTIFFALVAFVAQAQTNVETQRQYISGTGCDDMVEWDFMCTDGRNSGKWTKIGVPSCWELQGFGTYQYGMRFYGKATPEGIADEKGLYKTELKNKLDEIVETSLKNAANTFLISVFVSVG